MDAYCTNLSSVKFTFGRLGYCAEITRVAPCNLSPRPRERVRERAVSPRLTSLTHQPVPYFLSLERTPPMKKSLFLLMLTASLGAYAANHEVKMLDNGKDGSMVFEPGYVNAKVGDTVTFKAANKGHWVQSKALPDGVADFLSEDGKDFTLKLDKEGVYVYTCPPHRMMNMSGVIQVGKPVNKAKAQAVVDEMENRAMQSKGRLKKYMAQVK